MCSNTNTFDLNVIDHKHIYNLSLVKSMNSPWKVKMTHIFGINLKFNKATKTTYCTQNFIENNYFEVIFVKPIISDHHLD